MLFLLGKQRDDVASGETETVLLFLGRQRDNAVSGETER